MSNLTVLDEALSRRGITPEMWAALTNSVFPGAKDESIFLAVDYCNARKMDVMKKPVHIVGMMVEDAKTRNKEWRDVIMPGIYELRMTAFRTGQYLGMDKEEYGETITYKGVSAPESCTFTVYRDVNGHRVPFHHTSWFSEEVAEKKDGAVNAMWTKRPRGQLSKCAEAGALRKAFPDELGGVMSAEEMEGKIIEGSLAPSSEKGNAQRSIPASLPEYSSSDFDKNFSSWEGLIQSGKKSADAIIATLSSKFTLADNQKNRILDLEAAMSEQ